MEKEPRKTSVESVMATLRMCTCCKERLVLVISRKESEMYDYKFQARAGVALLLASGRIDRYDAALLGCIIDQSQIPEKPGGTYVEYPTEGLQA